MNRLLVEFFWSPEETVSWLKEIASARRIWFVLWIVGKEARLMNVDDLRTEMFVSNEDGIQLFLGGTAVSPRPEWRYVSSKRLFDFARSYAVQLVPSVMTPDKKILLLGRLAILRENQYENRECFRRLVTFFGDLRASMKSMCDSERVIVQDLTIGGRKVWKKILVGKSLPSRGPLQLKESTRSDVSFRIEAKREQRGYTTN